MKTINRFVNDYVDGMKVGQLINARLLARAYRDACIASGLPPKLPYSDTIQRVLRERRMLRGDIFYYDYKKSIWWKNDHVATAEERK